MKRLIGVKSHVKPRHILNVEQESRLRIGTWSRIAGLSCNFVVMIVLVPDSTGYLESQSPTVSWYLEGLDEHQGLCSFRTPMVLSSFPQSFRFQRTFATLSTIHQTSSLTSVSTRFYNSVSLIRLLPYYLVDGASLLLFKSLYASPGLLSIAHKVIRLEQHQSP